MNINNIGEVVGYRMDIITGETEAILLPPILEPQTYDMLLLWVGLAGFMASIRKRNYDVTKKSIQTLRTHCPK